MEEKIFPNETIIVTKYFDVHQDWEVPIPGFFIIANVNDARRSIAEFSEEEFAEFTKILFLIRKGMKDKLGIDKVCLFQNEASEHRFHLWILPRYYWMDQFGEKIESVRPIINYAKDNLNNKEIIKKVKEMVRVMKDYFKDF